MPAWVARRDTARGSCWPAVAVRVHVHHPVELGLLRRERLETGTEAHLVGAPDAAINHHTALSRGAPLRRDSGAAGWLAPRSVARPAAEPGRRTFALQKS